ncbi:MAG: hypothetical protein AAFU85_09255 [Planctomycetota bacterium]
MLEENAWGSVGPVSLKPAELCAMNLSSVHQSLRSFEPTGDESNDVGRLYDITDRIEADGLAAQCVADLLAVFERNPDADLGSPGPIVHCIETVPMAESIPLLAQSLERVPTIMTLWMAERCLRSDPAEDSEAMLVAAIKTIPNSEAASTELKSEATSVLASRDI